MAVRRIDEEQPGPYVFVPNPGMITWWGDAIGGGGSSSGGSGGSTGGGGGVGPTTPLEVLSSSDLKSGYEEWRENFLLNNLKVAMYEAKRLGQYPLVWQHGMTRKLADELTSKGFAIQRIDKWQYWLWDKADLEKWLESKSKRKAS